LQAKEKTLEVHTTWGRKGKIENLEKGGGEERSIKNEPGSPRPEPSNSKQGKEGRYKDYISKKKTNIMSNKKYMGQKGSQLAKRKGQSLGDG